MRFLVHFELFGQFPAFNSGLGHSGSWAFNFYHARAGQFVCSTVQTVTSTAVGTVGSQCETDFQIAMRYQLRSRNPGDPALDKPSYIGAISEDNHLTTLPPLHQHIMFPRAHDHDQGVVGLSRSLLNSIARIHLCLSL